MLSLINSPNKANNCPVSPKIHRIRRWYRKSSVQTRRTISPRKKTTIFCAALLSTCNQSSLPTRSESSGTMWSEWMIIWPKDDDHSSGKSLLPSACWMLLRIRTWRWRKPQSCLEFHTARSTDAIGRLMAVWSIRIGELLRDTQFLVDYNSFACRGPPGSYMVSRMREMWPGNGDEQNDLLNLVQRNRISMVNINFRWMVLWKSTNFFLQMQSDEVNGTNLIDMMHDEAMLEQLTKGFPRKMMNNLDVANLLKQVQSGAAQQHKLSSPPSAHSSSPRSASPHCIQPPQHMMMLTPVAPSTSSAIEPSK